jgi:hypothetical protein
MTPEQLAEQYCDKPREWFIDPQHMLVKGFHETRSFKGVHVIEYSAYKYENEKRNEAIALCGQMEKERDEARASLLGSGIHAWEHALSAERQRSARLVEALERARELISGMAMTSHPINVREPDGSITQERPLSNAGYANQKILLALSEHAKDSPVSAPKFDIFKAIEGRKSHLGLHGDSQFVKGARWQFNQIYPQGQSDTQAESKGEK